MLNPKPLKVLVVDDHPVVHDGVALQLARQPNIDIVGYAATAADAVIQCGREHPDIVLLDLRLPDALAAEVVPRLHAVSPGSKVLLFTAFADHAAVAPSLAAGACGLLVKEASRATLRDALYEVARTGHYRGPRPVPSAAPITPREYDVLRLVSAGNTNGEIGEQLGLSLNTVKTYLHSVMEKLGARNRAQVIMKANQHGLL